MDYKPYLYGLVWLGVWVTVVANDHTKKCVYFRSTFRMLTADCMDKKLDEIPKNLNSDIEVLYAADNKIRYLTNSSFQNYPDVKFIYLKDNSIYKIDSGVFSELTRLEVLDLTHNIVRNFPTDLPLPLRTLYLAENDELSDNLTLSAAYNLEILSLAKCQYTRFPSLGVLPNLKDLNLTLNPLEHVTPADLAPLCRLERLHLPPTLYQQPGSQCECHRLLTWASQHYVHMPGFNCTSLVDPDSVGCDMNLTKETQVYKSCLDVKPPPSTARYMMMAAVVGLLLLACLVIFCWWRKGRRKQNSVEDHRRPVKNKNPKSVDTLIV